jgi:hypothetical protein
MVETAMLNFGTAGGFSPLSMLACALGKFKSAHYGPATRAITTRIHTVTKTQSETWAKT